MKKVEILFDGRRETFHCVSSGLSVAYTRIVVVADDNSRALKDWGKEVQIFEPKGNPYKAVITRSQLVMDDDYIFLEFKRYGGD